MFDSFRNEKPSTQYIIFVVITTEEGAVSFFQDSTASPTYLLEGYCICFVSTKLIYMRLYAPALHKERAFHVPTFNSNMFHIFSHRPFCTASCHCQGIRSASYP